MKTDLEEFEKCKSDFYYFFTKYFLINGKTPIMTRDQFNGKIAASSFLLKRRG